MKKVRFVKRGPSEEGPHSTKGGDIQNDITEAFTDTELHLPVVTTKGIEKASFAGPGTTLVAAVWQLGEHVQASRNDACTDFRAPQLSLRPFGNFASMCKPPETTLAPISGLHNSRCGRLATSRACASLQKRRLHRFQGSTTLVAAVWQLCERVQASRNDACTDSSAPQLSLRPFGNFASVCKPPETTLAPISGLHNSRCGRLATSRACASLQKRRLHRFQGSTTLVAAVWQLCERVQASRNDACTDFRAPQLSLRPFGNFASMCKPPETTLAPISGLHNSRCGRLATSRACASLQKRRLHRFQGSTTLVAAVWQLCERVQASRNDACTDFRAPQLSLRPFGNFASVCKPPETTLAPISVLHNSRCGRLATSRACASLQKRRLHRFQCSTTLVAAVWQLCERVQASRNDACTDFRAPQLSLRPFGNFASVCKPQETTLAPISGLHNSRCGRLATSRACASLQKRRLHRFQGSTTLVAAVWQLRERVQASRNDACTDSSAPQLSLRPFGNFASVCKPPETTLAPISVLHNSRCGRLATSRACASLQKRRLHRFQCSTTLVAAVWQLCERVQASRNDACTDSSAPQLSLRPFGNFASVCKPPETTLAPISGLHNSRCGRLATSRACASLQKRRLHRFQGSTTLVAAVWQLRERVQAARNDACTDFRAPQLSLRPFGNFASVCKPPETTLAPISVLHNSRCGRLATSRACASLQKRRLHRFQGSTTLVAAVWQLREHVQASRNDACTDSSAPQLSLRPFGNFASVCKPPETTLAPISGLHNSRCGRLATSRACASRQKRRLHRFQGSTTLVAAVWQLRERVQASRNDACTDFRAPQLSLRPFGNFASMCKPPETTLAPISGLHNSRCGRLATSRACASLQKRRLHRFQGSTTLVAAVWQLCERVQASRNDACTDFRAPQLSLRPFGNFASVCKPPETTLAPISGLHNSRCGRLATSRACASLKKRRLHRFQGSTTLVAAVWQLREHVQASRNDACTDFRAPQLSLRPFGNFASVCKPPETTLAPISGLHNSRCGRLATSRACASRQKRRLHRLRDRSLWQPSRLPTAPLNDRAGGAVRPERE